MRKLNVVFLERLAMEKLGLMYISAVVRRAGHHSQLFLEGAEGAAFVDRVVAARPDLVAFSVTTGMHRWALEVAARIKARTETRILFGGPHATYSPEVIEKDPVDLVCRGEGEEAMDELLAALASGTSPRNIANFWVKEEGAIHRNEVRPLTQDLDSIPFPDWDLYYRYPYLRRLRSKPLLTGRGCSFQCTFCHNHLDMALYSGKGKWVRKRSPENIVAEIRELGARYPLEILNLERDDHLTIQRDWTFRFLEAYARQVDLPFVLQCRPETIDRETADALARARCASVTISFETANPFLRNSLLRKEIDDDQVIQAVQLLKERGIYVKTLNMIGLPGEDLDGALATLDFNIRLKPQFARCSIATPFPRTRLFEQSVNAGMLAGDHSSDDYFEDYFQKTVLDHPDGARLENLHKFFSIVVTFPWLLPVVKLLVRLPPNPLYYRVYLAAFVLYGSSFAGLGPRNVLDLIRYTPRPLPAPRAARRSWSLLAVLQRFSFNFD